MEQTKIWFLNTLVHVRVSCTDGHDGVSVLENLAPFGDSPPLHRHTTEDEIFHILDGQMRFQIEQDQRVCGPGEILCVPKGVRHTYRVESPQGARWVTITAHQDFEKFVRAAGRIAERNELPPTTGPTPQAIESLAAVARRFGIELVGPPLQ
jgi:quercetin dioxygenase-like cupin family protein